MMPIRKMKQLLLLISLIIALWLGAVVFFKQLPNNYGISDQDASMVLEYIPALPLHVLESQQTKRKKLIEDVCQLSNSDVSEKFKDKDMLDHLIVDDEHGLLYCYVPKVACTNWKRVLMVLMGKSNTSDPLQIVADDSHRLHVFRRLSNYSSEEASYRLQNYMKFMFVRHPFERLLSAYRNKFSQNYSSSEYFRVRYGKQIIKKFRPGASNESLSRGHDVTFQEFVQYIIDPRTVSQSSYNEHWRPMMELCHPCQIHYDVIGKYENLMDDSWLVLYKANLSQAIQFPHSDKASMTSTLMDQYLDTLSHEQLRYLYHVYELDFRLFDYRSKDLTT